NVLRHRVEERVELLAVQRRPGRVVRVADQNHARPVGHGRGHRRQVVPVGRGVRYADTRRARGRRDDRVRLEGAPRVQHLVARQRCPAIATEPQPVATRCGSTPYLSASLSRSATTPMSGYRCVIFAASVIASTTPGSGPKGTSLEASLIAPGAERPGTYEGN